jgi:hypothetical protein
MGKRFPTFAQIKRQGWREKSDRRLITVNKLFVYSRMVIFSTNVRIRPSKL